jgi:hypothetical protein
VTGWAADRHITPRVIEHLRDHLPDVPVKHRPRIGDAVAVLHALARWARREPGGEHDGMWLAADTVGQLEAQTGIAPGTIRNVLGALERVGLTVTLAKGGGTGPAARGATRRLVLDPVDGASTARAKHAQYKPSLRVPVPSTARATDATARARHATPRSSAFTTYPRAGKAGEGSTATTIDLTGLKPTDVLRCPNLPARKNAWCRHTCELCHGMGHIHAEQLGVT